MKLTAPANAVPSIGAQLDAETLGGIEWYFSEFWHSKAAPHPALPPQSRGEGK